MNLRAGQSFGDDQLRLRPNRKPLARGRVVSSRQPALAWIYFSMFRNGSKEGTKKDIGNCGRFRLRDRRIASEERGLPVAINGH
jgi:hypothetical protein